MVRNYVRKRKGPEWSKSDLDKAVEEVKSGRLSGYQAAAQFRIPRSTIMSHVNGIRGQKSDNMGRPKAISAEYEQKLANCLHVMEKNGFGLSRNEIFELVQTFVRVNKLDTPFTDDKPGQEWFKNFCSRHSLSIKKPQSVELSRKKATDPFIIQKYFDILFATINELGLENKPHRIWNIDETSFVSDPKKTKIVGLRGFASTRTTATAGKDNTTVLFSSNAAGGKGPPFIIYKGKNTWSEWTSEEAYPGTVYTATENGWIETKAFEEFISKSFIPTLGDPSEPSLLIYDGHSTHVQPAVLEIAKEHNITIIKLPPHSSHLLQPLDLAVFKPFKDKWDSAMVKWQRSNYGQKLSKKEFSVLVGQIWKSMESLTIMNGFKKGGIYPMNRDVIPEHKFDPVAFKRWENMKADSSLPINTSEQPEHNSVATHAENVNSVPKTLASLALKQVLMSLGNEDKSKGIDIVPQPVDRTFQSSTIECPTKTVGKSFEELILLSIKQNEKPVTIKKKTRIAGGAEIITHQDVIDKLKKNEEEKQKKCKKRKTAESKFSKKVITKTARKNLLNIVDNNQRSYASSMPSTSNCSTLTSEKNDSKKITILDDRYITDDKILLDNYNKLNNIKIHKNTVLNINNENQDENLNPKQKNKNINKVKKSKNHKKSAIKPLKRKNISDTSSESDYSVQDSDMSDSGNLDEFLKLFDIQPDVEDEEDFGTGISCALTDIKYFTESDQKYNVNDWVIVQFCTKKSIKHFVGQIISLNEKTPTIKYVRKVRSAKKESIFTYPVNNDICKMEHIEDILAVLPAPEISRRGHIIFKINFNSYNVQ